MGLRLVMVLPLVCLHAACGGSEFDAGHSPAGDASSGAGGGAGSSGGVGGGTGGGGGEGAAGSSGADGGADAGVDAGGGARAIEVVQASATVLTEQEVPTLALQSTPTAGNAVVVGITCISDFLADCIIGTTGVTDNQGNPYSRVVQGEPLLSSSQAARGYIFIAENISASDGEFVISVDPDGTPIAQSVVWGAIEVAGLAASPSLDSWGSSLPGSGTSTTATTDLPTTQANELAVAVFSMRSDDTNMLITPEADWVSHHVHQNGASGPPGHSMISRILTSTGIVSHTWAHDAPTRSAAAIIATFEGAVQD